ncbi:CoxG family protein [Alteribacillus sp. JSM 102045]|uniref:CoxG family protein n=1 Tax=Alteribacillus sp. JSM 102045 TaxID=1562101 RepID=UPI0035C1FAB1
MKISNSYEVPTDANTTYDLITDPDVLARTVPGLQSLNPIDENEYEAELVLGIKAVKGRYKGTVKLVDQVLGEEFRLVMDGQGPLGFVHQNMLIKLDQVSEDQTTVYCDGEATVGGVVAGIGQRMMSGVASLLMGQFFKALNKEISTSLRT